MKDTWDILIKELEVFGIKIINGECVFEYKGKKYKSKVGTKINLFKKEFYKNEEALKDILKQASDSLQVSGCGMRPLEDTKNIKLFIFSVKELYELSVRFSESDKKLKKFIFDNDISSKFKSCIDGDYQDFSNDIILSLPDFKIAIDFIYRKNCLLSYLASLLKLVKKEKTRINNIIIKEARGVQGPWGNLDLPKLERVFSWDDIQEEVAGRDRDKRQQKRYRMGHDNYSKGDKFGEGFYWREMANEPYSWDNRYTDSPYKQLSPGTWR